MPPSDPDTDRGPAKAGVLTLTLDGDGLDALAGIADCAEDPSKVWMPRPALGAVEFGPEEVIATDSFVMVRMPYTALGEVEGTLDEPVYSPGHRIKEALQPHDGEGRVRATITVTAQGLTIESVQVTTEIGHLIDEGAAITYEKTRRPPRTFVGVCEDEFKSPDVAQLLEEDPEPATAGVCFGDHTIGRLLRACPEGVATLLITDQSVVAYHPPTNRPVGMTMAIRAEWFTEEQPASDGVS